MGFLTRKRWDRDLEHISLRINELEKEEETIDSLMSKLKKVLDTEVALSPNVKSEIKSSKSNKTSSKVKRKRNRTKKVKR